MNERELIEIALEGAVARCQANILEFQSKAKHWAESGDVSECRSSLACARMWQSRLRRAELELKDHRAGGGPWYRRLIRWVEIVMEIDGWD